MMSKFCRKPLRDISKYASVAQKCCHRLIGHKGKCAEFPFLDHLRKTHKRVADKIRRDATMTTGAAWKSDDAGPNRILRWIMLLPDTGLKEFGIDMKKLRPEVVSKLRDKAATYEDCINVAIKLAWLVYQMPDAPRPPSEIEEYLASFHGQLVPGTTKCELCLLPLSFELFAEARRGKARIETCHKDPRLHNPENVGFAHRECNIAQGSKNINEFYDWIEGILNRVGRI
jgi:hypothetical protein